MFDTSALGRYVELRTCYLHIEQSGSNSIVHLEFVFVSVLVFTAACRGRKQKLTSEPVNEMKLTLKLQIQRSETFEVFKSTSLNWGFYCQPAVLWDLSLWCDIKVEMFVWNTSKATVKIKNIIMSSRIKRRNNISQLNWDNSAKKYDFMPGTLEVFAASQFFKNRISK